MEQTNNLQWILTPREVCDKIIIPMDIHCQPRALFEIESKHKKRAEWIVEHLKHKKEDEEIKKKEAIEQKLNLMDGQDMDSQKSDESEEE